MEPYILHQPVKISEVFLLPPVAKARGALMVSIARIKYRSAISMISLKDLNMTTIPKTTISSHAPGSP